MSMFNDVFGMGRTSIMESVNYSDPEIESITMESVQPLRSDIDPMDFIIQVAYENEMNMQRLDMAILAEEYMYLKEHGTEMIYESGGIQGVIDKCEKGIEWLWTQITKFFKKVISEIEKKLALDKNFLKNYKSRAEQHGGKVSVKVKSGITTESLNPDVFQKYCFGIYTQFIAASSVVYERVGGKVIDKLSDNHDYKAAEYDAVFSGISEDDVEASEKAIVRMLTGGQEGTFDEMIKDKLKEAYTLVSSDEDKNSKVDFDVKTCITYFEKSKKAKENIKAAYDAAKKVINAQKKSVKKMEGKLKKFKVIPTEASSAVHKTVKVINKLGSWLTQVHKLHIKGINNGRKILKQVIVLAATGTAKNQEKNIDTFVNAGKKMNESFIGFVEFPEIG